MWVMNPNGLSGALGHVVLGGGLNITCLLEIVYRVGSIIQTDIKNGYPLIGEWELLPDNLTAVSADDSDQEFECGYIGGVNKKSLLEHQHNVVAHIHTIASTAYVGDNGYYYGSNWANVNAQVFKGNWVALHSVSVEPAGSAAEDLNMQPGYGVYYYVRVK